MALSIETRRLLHTYDSFTNFAGGPDLPWDADVYHCLNDDTVIVMVRSLCYAWATGQRAVGYYNGEVEQLAHALFLALPYWDEAWPREAKRAWLYQLGVHSVAPEPEPRPATQPIYTAQSDVYHLTSSDREPLEDMAAFFRIPMAEAVLLFRIGQALGIKRQHVIPSPTPPKAREHNGTS
jgi:hypothetical protein